MFSLVSARKKAGDTDDQEIIKQLTTRNKKLITKVSQFKDDSGRVTVSRIKEGAGDEASPELCKFLYLVAEAEGFGAQ